MLVDSRIVINAAYFRKVNPNFYTAQLKLIRFDDLPLVPPPPQISEVKNIDVDVREMKDEDFLICSPVVYGFSLKDKL